MFPDDDEFFDFNNDDAVNTSAQDGDLGSQEPVAGTDLLEEIEEGRVGYPRKSDSDQPGPPTPSLPLEKSAVPTPTVSPAGPVSVSEPAIEIAPPSDSDLEEIASAIEEEVAKKELLPDADGNPFDELSKVGTPGGGDALHTERVVEDLLEEIGPSPIELARKDLMAQEEKEQQLQREKAEAEEAAAQEEARRLAAEEEARRLSQELARAAEAAKRAEEQAKKAAQLEKEKAEAEEAQIRAQTAQIREQALQHYLQQNKERAEARKAAVAARARAKEEKLAAERAELNRLREQREIIAKAEVEMEAAKKAEAEAIKAERERAQAERERRERELTEEKRRQEQELRQEQERREQAVTEAEINLARKHAEWEKMSDTERYLMERSGLAPDFELMEQELAELRTLATESLPGKDEESPVDNEKHAPDSPVAALITDEQDDEVIVEEPAVDDENVELAEAPVLPTQDNEPEEAVIIKEEEVSGVAELSEQNNDPEEDVIREEIDDSLVLTPIDKQRGMVSQQIVGEPVEKVTMTEPSVIIDTDENLVEPPDLSAALLAPTVLDEDDRDLVPPQVEMTPLRPVKNKKQRSWLMWTLVSLLMAACAVLGYLYYETLQDNRALEREVATVNDKADEVALDLQNTQERLEEAEMAADTLLTDQEVTTTSKSTVENENTRLKRENRALVADNNKLKGEITEAKKSLLAAQRANANTAVNPELVAKLKECRTAQDEIITAYEEGGELEDIADRLVPCEEADELA